MSDGYLAEELEQEYAEKTAECHSWVEVPFNKEQMQLEKLLQIIEKNPSATQAYYAGVYQKERFLERQETSNILLDDLVKHVLKNIVNAY